MLDLIKAKATGFVKVKGVIMCILGAQHSQYANVIGTWVHEKLGKEDFNGVQDNFLDYLLNHLHEEKSNANLRISGSCAWCPQIANCMD
jgi:hypothetical protein